MPGAGMLASLHGQEVLWWTMAVARPGPWLDVVGLLVYWCSVCDEADIGVMIMSGQAHEHGAWDGSRYHISNLASIGVINPTEAEYDIR